MGFFDDLVRSGIQMAANGTKHTIQKSAADNFAKSNRKEMSYAMAIVYCLYLTDIESDSGIGGYVNFKNYAQHELGGVSGSLCDSDEIFKDYSIENILEFISYAYIELSEPEQIAVTSRELPILIGKIKNYILKSGNRKLCVDVYLFMLRMHFSGLILSSNERNARLYLFKKSLGLQPEELLHIGETMSYDFGWSNRETKEKLNGVDVFSLHYLRKVLPEYKNIPDDIAINYPEEFLDYKNMSADNFDDLQKVVQSKKNYDSIVKTLKILTFLLGRKKELLDDDRKFINFMLDRFFSEELKNLDFNVSEEINSAYSDVLKLKLSSDFFSNNKFNQNDKDLRQFFFVVSFASVALIWQDNMEEETRKLYPQYVYNLYLIQKNLNISDEDKSECLKLLAEQQKVSLNEIENLYNCFLSDESISMIRKHSPEILDDFRPLIEFEYQKIAKEIGKKSALVTIPYKSPENSFEKLRLAIRNLSKNIDKAEKPILIFDNSMLESCRSGFFITDKHIYTKSSLSFEKKCLDVSEIKEIDVNSSYLSSSINFDGTNVDTEQIGVKGNDLVGEFVKFVIEIIKSPDCMLSIPTIAEILGEGESISNSLSKSIDVDNSAANFESKSNYGHVENKDSDKTELSIEENNMENNSNEMQKSPKKKSVTLLLCLLLGCLGIHRFYVGKIKSGGALLFLSMLSGGTVGLIWELYDLFTLIFTNKFTDSNDLPLS